jgi:hypothetical protein
LIFYLIFIFLNASSDTNVNGGFVSSQDDAGSEEKLLMREIEELFGRTTEQGTGTTQPYQSGDASSAASSVTLVDQPQPPLTTVERVRRLIPTLQATSSNPSSVLNRVFHTAKLLAKSTTT